MTLTIVESNDAAGPGDQPMARAASKGTDDTDDAGVVSAPY